MTVLKLTQVGEDKCPQALEITVLKELGNLTPYVRNKGSLQANVTVGLRAQGNGSGDCLSKTQFCANT